jgi:hypothetical protein
VSGLSENLFLVLLGCSTPCRSPYIVTFEERKVAQKKNEETKRSTL